MIEEKDDVSFAELERIDGFKGDKTMGRNEFNIVFWSGLSEAGVNALVELIAEDLVDPVPCNQIVYLIDGAYQELPIATEIRKYPTPHWIPLVFRRTRKERSLVLKDSKPARKKA